MNALTKTESTALAPTRAPQFDLSPQTFEQALTFSEYLANSDMVPKDFKGKPGNCLVAIQWGMEIGLKPLQAMQNIAVINGRPSLWGDAVIALARNFPLCEYIIEEDDGRTATCKVKRRGEAEQKEGDRRRSCSRSRALPAGGCVDSAGVLHGWPSLHAGDLVGRMETEECITDGGPRSGKDDLVRIGESSRLPPSPDDRCGARSRPAPRFDTPRRAQGYALPVPEFLPSCLPRDRGPQVAPMPRISPFRHAPSPTESLQPRPRPSRPHNAPA